MMYEKAFKSNDVEGTISRHQKRSTVYGDIFAGDKTSQKSTKFDLYSVLLV